MQPVSDTDYIKPRKFRSKYPRLSSPKHASILDLRNIERGFIALSEKKKKKSHTRMGGGDQGCGMHSSTFLQTYSDGHTALPFFFPGLSRGRAVFLVHLTIGSQERSRGTGQMSLPNNQHLLNSAHLTEESMFLPAQFAD